MSDLSNSFGFHKATVDTAPLHTQIRTKSLELAEWLEETLPDGREKSLALTNLQQSQMWANAAVAINLAPLVEE